MIPHPQQQAVIDEHADLVRKLDEFHSFIISPQFDRFDAEDQALMVRQKSVMCDYVNILAERIRRMK